LVPAGWQSYVQLHFFPRFDWHAWSQLWQICLVLTTERKLLCCPKTKCPITVTSNMASIYATIATDLAIWLANLPLSIRVQTTLLLSVCHAMPFSARALKKKPFLWPLYCGKKQIEMWLSVVCTLIDNNTRHLLWTHSAVPHESTTFWPLWWHIIVDKSSDHAKPYSIC